MFFLNFLPCYIRRSGYSGCTQYHVSLSFVSTRITSNSYFIHVMLITVALYPKIKISISTSTSLPHKHGNSVADYFITLDINLITSINALESECDIDPRESAPFAFSEIFLQHVRCCYHPSRPAYNNPPTASDRASLFALNGHFLSQSLFRAGWLIWTLWRVNASVVGLSVRPSVSRLN